MSVATSNLAYLSAKAAARLPFLDLATRIRLLAIARRHQVLRRGGSEGEAGSEERAVAGALTTAAATLDAFRALEQAAGRGDFPHDVTRLRVRGDIRPDATTAAVARLARGLTRAPSIVVVVPSGPRDAFTDRLISAIAAQSAERAILVVGEDASVGTGGDARCETRHLGDLPQGERARALGYLMRALVPERLIAFDEGAARAMLDEIGPALSRIVALEFAVQDGRSAAEAIARRRPYAAAFRLEPGDGAEPIGSTPVVHVSA